MKGLPTFAIMTVAVLLALRLVHLTVPHVFPSTRIGPVEVSSFEAASARLGFAPILPGYRPASLGAKPISISVVYVPAPSLNVAWRQGNDYLSITQTRGGSKPYAPPHAAPMADVSESTWWTVGSENHIIVSRVGFWIEITTNLPPGELQRFAATLAVY